MYGVLVSLLVLSGFVEIFLKFVKSNLLPVDHSSLAALSGCPQGSGFRNFVRLASLLSASCWHIRSSTRASTSAASVVFKEHYNVRNVKSTYSLENPYY